MRGRGGFNGIVTMEDLLEEIVGNIYDEFDPVEEKEIEQLEDGVWRMRGSVDVDTVEEIFDIDLPEDEFDTLGGLVFSLLESIPDDGECPVVEGYGLRVSVEVIEDRRVEWARVELIDKEPKEY